MFKCHIPSFVSDHVQVVTWHDTEGAEYALNENYGTLESCLESTSISFCPLLICYDDRLYGCSIFRF